MDFDRPAPEVMQDQPAPEVMQDQALVEMMDLNREEALQTRFFLEKQPVGASCQEKKKGGLGEIPQHAISGSRGAPLRACLAICCQLEPA